MKKMNCRIACGCLAAALLTAGLTGCGNLDGTSTVATIDGEDVSLGLASYVVRDLQAQTVSMYMSFLSSYGGNGNAVLPDIWDGKGDDGKTYGESAKDDAMDVLKEMYVLRAHADEYEVSLSDEEESKIKETADAFMAANDEETLEKLLVSEEDIIRYLELATYKVKMRDPMVADVDQEVSEEEANQTEITMVQISTEGTETDEDGNPVELTEEEKAEKKELAQQVLEKVQAEADPAAADMDVLAKEVDESLSAGKRDFTTADPENSATDSKVCETALALNEGQVAPEVVEGTDGSYYIVRLDQKLDQEATDAKKDEIISNRKDEAYKNLLDQWKKDAKLDIKESLWKKVTVTDSAQFTYKMEDAAAEPAADESSTDTTTEDTEEAAPEADTEE